MRSGIDFFDIEPFNYSRSSCDTYASSAVTVPVKTSSCRFPTASRYVSVVSPDSTGRVVSLSRTILSGSAVELSESF